MHVTSDKYSLLSRFINIFFALNATLFYASRLVINGGYWFPLVAAALFLIAEGIMLWPWTDLKSNKVYLTCFITTALGAYFTVASIVYWIQHPT